MKRVIHIGEGRHIEIEEGALRESLPKAQVRPKEDVPGLKAWVSHRHKQVKSISPNMGRLLGGRPGYNKQDTLWAWKVVKEQVKRDMANIKKAGIDLDSAAEEALGMSLELMRGPTDAKTKLAAARQVLEWTKAKPVSKSEVTVNTAEAWLASLAEEDDGKDVQ